jgi:hypothetical protein
VQEWRKTGFFVPGLPSGKLGYPDGELYSFGDVVALRVMRRLLGAGVDREVVAAVGEDVPGWNEDSFWSLRGLFVGGEEPWWLGVPFSAEVLSGFRDEEGAPEFRCYETSWLTQQLESDDEFAREGELVVWTSSSSGSGLMVWLPYSEVIAELATDADGFRRRRRIKERDWPPWM